MPSCDDNRPPRSEEADWLYGASHGPSVALSLAFELESARQDFWWIGGRSLREFCSLHTQHRHLLHAGLPAGSLYLV
jgi:hypothetical protein